jgi:CBS domain-containing protein
MSYQGNDPNRRREQRRTGTPQRQPQSGQPRAGQGQQSQWQGQPTQTPKQQPQTQLTQEPSGGQRQPGGGRQPGRHQSGVPQGGMQPGSGHQSLGHQQQRTQPPQSGAQVGTQGAGQHGQFTQQASLAQSAPAAGASGMGAPPQPRRTRLSPSSVEDVVSTDLVTATRDTPLATVAAMMNENDVGCVIVVEDDEETPIGVLTDRKIALAVESEPEIGKRTAEELVSSDLLTGRTDMTVFEALDKLKQAGVRRLPIVDEAGTLTGIVTLDDLLVLLGTNLGDAADIIAAQTTRHS